jgi:hypothetical protein
LENKNVEIIEGPFSKKKLGGWQRKKKLEKQNVKIVEGKPLERKTLGEE